MKVASILSVAMAALVIFSACKKDKDKDDETKVPAHKVGDNYGGGIVFYVDASGDHGLIAATQDQGTGEWGCKGTDLNNAEGTSIGTGQANTTAILAGCTTQGIAAYKCDTLTLNGYTDWYLPSKDELNELRAQQSVVGGFVTTGLYGYWSSTNRNADEGYRVRFDQNEPSSNIKNAVANIRAIRSF